MCMVTLALMSHTHRERERERERESESESSLDTHGSHSIPIDHISTYSSHLCIFHSHSNSSVIGVVLYPMDASVTPG